MVCFDDDGKSSKQKKSGVQSLLLSCYVKSKQRAGKLDLSRL